MSDFKELARLTSYLHVKQCHPDFEYAVTFEGNTAHKDMGSWTQNADRQQVTDAKYNAISPEHRNNRQQREIWWRKRKAEQ